MNRLILLLLVSLLAGCHVFPKHKHGCKTCQNGAQRDAASDSTPAGDSEVLPIIQEVTRSGGLFSGRGFEVGLTLKLAPTEPASPQPFPVMPGGHQMMLANGGVMPVTGVAGVPGQTGGVDQNTLMQAMLLQQQMQQQQQQGQGQQADPQALERVKAMEERLARLNDQLGKLNQAFGPAPNAQANPSSK